MSSVVEYSQASVHPPRHGVGRRLTLLLVSTLTIMAGATISPSLPAIEAHFRATEHAALLTRFVLTMPSLFIALSAPLVGLAADRIGRRMVLLAAIVLYGLAGMSGLIVESLQGLLVGRALLGIAVAGIMTSGTALVADYFAGPERDRFMGLQSAFVGFGGLMFLVGGGLLAEVHWRFPFGVYGFAILLVPLVALFILDPSRVSEQVAARHVGRPSRGTGMALLAVLATALISNIIFYLIPTQLPFHLQSLGIGAPSQAGLAIGLMSLAAATVSLVFGRLRSSLGPQAMFALSFALMATGFALVGLAAAFPAVLAATVIVGLGLGLVMPNLSSTAMSLADPAKRGRVSGALTASIFIGHFVSPLMSQPLIRAVGSGGVFLAGSGLLACLMILTATAAWKIHAQASPTSVAMTATEFSSAYHQDQARHDLVGTLSAGLRAMQRHRAKRRMMVRLSRLDPHLIRDIGFDPELVYAALDGSWDEVDPGSFHSYLPRKERV
ncbi:MAG TPA: MFS transporter [Mesorhizobium sp.]|jgi:MFS family permease|nr:MFS transporter [Mesorhizobium sp.]